ncbi:hypothetical protein KXD96_22790 [Mycobacterium sp. SMC-2]|uniref:hypothetical protein n=1 Tax=Mycobacterium sp. SMC-2 TaxID=2857058 RepID=UPI0021B3CE88|nr:hypothetical protein [Mycobacterium sp. SMC-2]UXA05704.1 hypothetical protein KXD96_22790 [Mycobacterium sp. SMC-2]
MNFVVVSVRDYLASQHLWTARREAWLCRIRENELVAQGNGNFDPKRHSHAVTAVLSAVAFLEGLVNSSWQDAADQKSTVYTQGIPQAALTRMRELWPDYEMRSMLDKFQFGLELVGQQCMPKDRDPYRSVRVLIQVRNALVHFKPHDRRVDTDEKFERQLKSKITTHRENQQPIGRPWFPNKALGAGTAEWACESSMAFAREWHTLMGLTYDFEDLYRTSEPYEVP